MFIKVTLRVLLGIMIVINAFNFSYKNPLLFIITCVVGIMVACLDLYHDFTRKKVLTYMAGTVFLIVWYAAIDQGWITALTFI
ncbi:hypothetical protein [Paenibacillus sp. DMB5]|uniref:hypothetical protein n=1 Tax=Paenibacillus sp. DMB5 TaxID=1780103 RepID=UPI00076CB3EC|nr:hypothetical protein [Paenibacillus sp. DMB5]KUP25825.1 hypothetical protein AWJ19_01250 [Paenibacillus sp. DMB5]